MTKIRRNKYQSYKERVNKVMKKDLPRTTKRTTKVIRDKSYHGDEERVSNIQFNSVSVFFRLFEL